MQIDTTKGNQVNIANQEESKGKAAAQNDIILVPKFIAGLKGDVKDNIFFLNENEVIYPAGHNVIIFNIEDKTQRYIQGIEGTEGITALALTKSKRWLAVAEKHEKSPICTIYNMNSLKRYKIIASTEISKQKEFISMAFCPKNEKLLVTLTNEP